MSGNIKGQSEKKERLVYFSTGSNLGNRLENLEKAKNQLQAEVGILIKSSSIYESEAWGKKNQAAFLNQILVFQTSISPKDVLFKIQSIENKIGRIRNEKWGPRTIDVDILFYNNKIINEIDLIIPHPEIANRRFVLMPILEISPDLIHPISNTSIKVLSMLCEDTSKVELYIS